MHVLLLLHCGDDESSGGVTLVIGLGDTTSTSCAIETLLSCGPRHSSQGSVRPPAPFSPLATCSAAPPASPVSRPRELLRGQSIRAALRIDHLHQTHFGAA